MRRFGINNSKLVTEVVVKLAEVAKFSNKPLRTSSDNNGFNFTAVVHPIYSSHSCSRGLQTPQLNEVEVALDGLFDNGVAFYALPIKDDDNIRIAFIRKDMLPPTDSSIELAPDFVINESVADLMKYVAKHLS